MTEFLLIIFAAGLIYYVATRVAPHGLIFKLKKEEVKAEDKTATKKPAVKKAAAKKTVTKKTATAKETK